MIKFILWTVSIAIAFILGFGFGRRLIKVWFFTAKEALNFIWEWITNLFQKK